MRSLRTSSRPLEIIALVPSIFPSSYEDVVFLKDSQALHNRLGEKFKKPLLHRASLSGNSLCDRHLSLDAFWAHLREQPTKTIDVYDYSVVDSASRTRQMTVQEVLLHWERPQRERHALNLLDIEKKSETFALPR